MDHTKIKILSKEQIFAIQDVPEEVVEIPEWGDGVGVLVRGMTVKERLEFVEDTRGTDGKTDNRKATFKAILLGVKEPQFTEADIPMLEARSPQAMDRISKAWFRLSGIDQDAIEKARVNS